MNTELDQLIEATAKHFNTTPDEMRTKTRRENVSDARAVIQHYQKFDLDWTLQKIGDYWGGYHPSSVAYNCKKVDDLGLMV